MLGSDLASRLAAKHEVLGVGRSPAPHLQIPYQVEDLSRRKETTKFIDSIRPQVILHSAAMTDVDRCESERSQALRGNLEITRNVTDAANGIHALLVFFSTDYVFDGTKQEPYLETDDPHPIDTYGESKLLAERYLLMRGRRFLILRSSWTFGRHGNNFPKKVLKQAEAGQRLQVVSDQFGGPTYTSDLAEAVGEILESLARCGTPSENQIYHIANQGRVSRYEFAREVLKRRNYPLDLVVPTSSDQSARPAKRPQNSVLSTEKLKAQFGVQLRSWEQALEAYLQEEAERIDASA